VPKLSEPTSGIPGLLLAGNIRELEDAAKAIVAWAMSRLRWVDCGPCCLARTALETESVFVEASLPGRLPEAEKELI